jgi:hypothetical protein
MHNLSSKLYHIYVCYMNIMLNIAFRIICIFPYLRQVLEHITHGYGSTTIYIYVYIKGKAIPLQALSVPGGWSSYI